MGDTGSLSMKRKIAPLWDSERKTKVLLQQNDIRSVFKCQKAVLWMALKTKKGK